MLKYAYRLGAAQAVKEAYALSGGALGAGVGGLTGYAAPEWFGDDLSRGGGALRGAVGGGVLGGLAGGWRGASAGRIKAEAAAVEAAEEAAAQRDALKSQLQDYKYTIRNARYDPSYPQMREAWMEDPTPYVLRRDINEMLERSSAHLSRHNSFLEAAGLPREASNEALLDVIRRGRPSAEGSNA